MLLFKNEIFHSKGNRVKCQPLFKITTKEQETETNKLDHEHNLKIPEILKHIIKKIKGKWENRAKGANLQGVQQGRQGEARPPPCTTHTGMGAGNKSERGSLRDGGC